GPKIRLAGPLFDCCVPSRRRMQAAECLPKIGPGAALRARQPRTPSESPRAERRDDSGLRELQPAGHPMSNPMADLISLSDVLKLCGIQNLFCCAQYRA